ncbi:MAG TPA: UPF0280 family protein [Candidatus Lokiarchaeia archaeon]|nr:UPF0280 family protein [Candidatus Lokiarchaeia archaeon]
MEKYRSHFTFAEAEVTIVTDVEDVIGAAQRAVRMYYRDVESVIAKYPLFRASLEPTNFTEIDPKLPKVAQIMEAVTTPFGIGPMAAVAGAIVDLVYEYVRQYAPEVLIIEDGGEVLAHSIEPVTIGLYAGEAALGAKLAFEIAPEDMPLGISTSSATVGHALSFGKADAATMFAKDCATADAAATFFCNSVTGDDIPQSIDRALAFLPEYESVGVRGAFIVRETHVGAGGFVPRLVKIRGTPEDLLDRKRSAILLDDENLR